MRDLQAALDQRRAEGLYRQRRLNEGPQTPRLQLAGQNVLNFCSNDYLGLANHPALAAALHRGIEAFGVGSGASHLVTGHSRAHARLEEALAEFTGRDRALLFSTGYMANLGTVSALVGRGDAVLQDRLNHASLLDAGRLAGARLTRYAHGDVDDLTRRLARLESQEKLLATDGVFSMDGDLAPLPAIAELARRQDAWLLVDDAHGLGVLGESGGGCLAHFGLDAEQVPILMGTLGKALGCFGAFVAGSNDLIEYLIQFARSYIYTTALPPALAAATHTALQIARSETWRRAHLQALIARFRQASAELDLPLMPSATPIQPLLIGDSQAALNLSQALEQQGILVTAIRPPTVPPGTARLRITFNASHSEADIDRLLTALDVALPAS